MTDASHNRLFLVAVLLMSLVATLLLRSFSLQVLGGADSAQDAADNRARTVRTPAARGLVLDQQGRVLIGNRLAQDVVVLRAVLRRQPDGGREVLARLAAVLDTDADTLAARTRNCGTRGARPLPACWNGPPSANPTVARDIGAQRAARILEQPAQFPGVEVVASSLRTYPAGELAAQVLGYTSVVSAEDAAADPTLQGLTEQGRSGLERQYDQSLRGRPGVRWVHVDASGHEVSAQSATPATAGMTLVTTLDAKVQAATEKALRKAMANARIRADRVSGRPLKADSGAAVVLDVRTGDVLAMASAPGYDANIWVNGISGADYDALTAPGSSQPLLNRAIAAAAAPASTFKVVSTAAALEHGWSPDASYPCNSSYKAGGRSFGNFESRSYGPITLARALEVSCDTIFYRIAHRMWLADGGSNPKGVPDDAIANMAADFGFGATTGIDLPGEAAGTVASRAAKQRMWDERHTQWCQQARDGFPGTAPDRAKYLRALARENCREGMLWRVGDAVNSAIGQGDTVVTPLQMAVAYAAVANGGTRWQPRLAKALLNPDGTVARQFQPVPAGRVPVPGQTLDYLRRALRGVIDQGTARNAFASFPTRQVPLAGKTGTAEVYGKQSTSWFASFAPADDPKYAVVMMVSQGGTGASTSGRAVKGIYRALFGVADGKVQPGRSVLVGGDVAGQLPTLSPDGIPVAPAPPGRTRSGLAAPAGSAGAGGSG